MATSYYTLQPPVTCLKLEETGIHTRISVWVNHALSGVLTVRDDEVYSMISLFASDHATIKTVYGGAVVRLEIAYDEGLPDNTQVIGDCLKLTTVGDMRAMQGQDRIT